MSDLISRQDAIDALTEANLKRHMDSVEGGQENRSAIRIIMTLPSAERKGKWIRMTADGVYWYECSECHEKPLLNRWHKQDEMSKFCPNCGASMGWR